MDIGGRAVVVIITLAVLVGGVASASGGEYGLKEIRAVYLYEPGCPFCARFEKETLAEERVREGLGRLERINVNAFTDDPVMFGGKMTPQRRIASMYGVNFFPTMLFLNPEGKEIARIRGFFETPDFLEMLGYVTGGNYTRESFETYLDRLAREPGGVDDKTAQNPGR